ncbi:hypothetical protein E2R51_13515 [Jeotgalibacillus sp. S-D1]|uniref:DUF6376 family protein n=1 Tax=Jeotgalibacillus sp. S-D1 TaxID=2552189 RepID=UPI0010596114|nr:DUF6376 family protein [Jeotgalibacillus sp. S-D1]TDL31382.1 hypothetical protein E2R51_13515 [Jeotgalibacillus sp. S-D1]
MKKILCTTLFAISLFVLGGCSILEEVNSSLNYANESTEYINELQDFGENAPSLLQDAATNPDAKAELEAQITTLKANINEFNDLEEPSIAADLHNSVVEKNEQLLNGIDTAMESGELSVEKLQNTEIFSVINEMTQLLDQIQQLEL